MKILNSFISSGAYLERCSSFVSLERILELVRVYLKQTNRCKNLCVIVCELALTEDKLVNLDQLEFTIEIFF